jgi:NADPH:quinone reductase-like Zn-dependent oxidoreductase
MHQIQLQLTDDLYEEATRRAIDAGFKSVDEFIADVLSGELAQETETFDHFFTPERIAHLDRVAECVRAGGRIYTPEELNANLAARRADWIRKNGE